MLRSSRLILNLFATLLAVSTLLVTSESRAGSVEEDAYFHIGIGGLFNGGNRPHLDPRVAFQFEAGNQFISLPINFSYGQDFWIVGMKPRVQYLFTPSSQVPSFRVGPGLGPVLNYWTDSVDAGDLDVYEFGVQFSIHVQYVFLEQFSVMFSPTYDLNFWRYLRGDGGASTSETKLRNLLGINLGLGVIF